MSKVKFVVVGVQRSGTTFIGTSLDSHPDIAYFGEVFKVRGWYLNRATKKPTRRKPYQGESGYSSWSDKSVFRQLGHFFWRAKMTRNYLDNFYESGSHKATGFKLMSSQSRRFKEIIPYMVKNKVKAIHIVRKNVLKTHISRLVASSRSVYHSDKSIDAPKITVPVSNLIASMEKITAENARWEEALRDSTDYIQVSYESFVQNRVLESEKMLEFLGVSYQDIQSPLVKINPDSLQDFIENYNEVESVLTGTEYQWTL